MTYKLDELDSNLVTLAKQRLKDEKQRQLSRKERGEMAIKLFMAGASWSEVAKATGVPQGSLARMKKKAEEIATLEDRHSKPELDAIKKDLGPMLLRKAHQLLDIPQEDFDKMSTAQRVTAGAIIFDKYRLESNLSTKNVLVGSSTIEELERRKTKKKEQVVEIQQDSETV